MRVGVLAVQGAFAEHISVLNQFGIEGIELRQKSDALRSYDALILPGGESTVQGRLLRQLYMFDTIKDQITAGIPVLATCAGLILLADSIENDAHVYFQTLPVRVKRNAYGRQLGSFHVTEAFETLGEVPMTFIRAPYIKEASDTVRVLARVDDRIAAVQYQNQLAMSFHPELDSDTGIYEKFMQMI